MSAGTLSIDTAAPLRPLYVTSGAASFFAAVYTAAAIEPVGLVAMFISYAPVISLVMCWAPTLGRDVWTWCSTGAFSPS